MLRLSENALANSGVFEVDLDGGRLDLCVCVFVCVCV